MEKQEKQNCSLLPHACGLGLSEPRSVNKPEFKPAETNPPVKNSMVKKPWSVFEGVYWI